MWKSSVFFVSTLLWSLVLSQSENCTTPLGRTSVCVSLDKCPELHNALNEISLPESVVSFLKSSQCGSEGNFTTVCCGPLPADLEGPQTSRPTQRPTQTPTQGISAYNQEDSSPAPRNQCGVDKWTPSTRSPSTRSPLEDRVFGGTITDLDEFPWMALLGYRTSNGIISYRCGGMLINHRYVLTAAHCITGAIEETYGPLTTVRLGEYDTQKEVDCVDSVCADPPQEIPVVTAVAHPGYSDKSKNKQDDIGIVRLARRADYTYYIKPICLVDNRDRLETGNKVYLAGWGKTLTGQKSPIKRKLGLPIFDKAECVSIYKTRRLVLGENQLCAGGVFAEDACGADSGGPLMKRRPEGIWEAVGVISFGIGCGGDGWPGVSTSVAKYTDWIKNTLQTTNV